MKLNHKVTLAILMTTPYLAFADSINENDTDHSLADFLNRFKNYLLTFVGALAVFFIVYGGFLMITSSGDPKRLEAAKKTITYAVIGLIVVILAQTIYMLLTGTLANFFGSGTATI